MSCQLPGGINFCDESDSQHSFAGSNFVLLGLFTFVCAVKPANVNKPSKTSVRPTNHQDNGSARPTLCESQSLGVLDELCVGKGDGGRRVEEVVGCPSVFHDGLSESWAGFGGIMGDRCGTAHGNRYDPTGPVFISYRQSDGIEHAKCLDRFLRAGGLMPWRDLVDLPPGETARREIGRAHV